MKDRPRWDIQTKRVYEPAKADDGRRILVDRVWPRGISKERAKADLWLKEVAPSTLVRKAFGHDPAKWDTFKRDYFRELEANPEAMKPIMDAAKKGRVTLLYSAHDEEHNQAVALREFLLSYRETR